MSRAKVRAAGPADAELVAVLMSEFNAILGADSLPEALAFAPEHVNVSASQMARRLEAMSGIETAYVAWLDSEPAGLACLRLCPNIGQDAPYAELTQLYVRERFQRRGVGAALVAEVERIAMAAGATAMHIITARNNNDGPQAFYSVLGYHAPCVEFEKHFVTEGAHA